MNNTTITLRTLWIRHIERFPERMRPRLYGALIAFLLHGTPIPEKLMPYLGIILDLIEAEKRDTTGNSDSSDSSGCPVAPPAEELEYLRSFTEDCAPRYCENYDIDSDTFKTIVRNIFDYWQQPLSGREPVRHKNEDDFWKHMSSAVYNELAVTRRIRPKAG
ncbi:MAG: hypothetical protein K2M19_02015 [Muribaculaceae bacterium]|nr:hypothetical protein [Muribaculaceae bacterium]